MPKKVPMPTLNKDDPAVLLRMGNIFLREEKFSEAANAYAKSILIDPKNADAQFRLGLSHYHLKEFELAKKQFEIVLSLDHRYLNVNQCLANYLLELRDHEKAMHYYFRQLEIEPWFETYYNIGILLMMKERLKDALTYFDLALQKSPNDVATILNFATIYLKQNKIDDAIFYYQKANTLKPNDAEIQHILSALKQNKPANKAPVEYVTHLFDQYAAYYDYHLTDRLKYTVPKKMLDIVQLEFPMISPESQWVILDLGCGTGLCGTLFKPYAKKLMGVDLSENMLHVAREKNCYDELLKKDIQDAVVQFSAVDLILAADVFTYIGDLKSIFLRIKQALKSQGLFIFTVEKTVEKNFVLQQSIRYAHHKHTIESLCAQCGFTILRFENVELRLQEGRTVEGYIVACVNLD